MAGMGMLDLLLASTLFGRGAPMGFPGVPPGAMPEQGGANPGIPAGLLSSLMPMGGANSVPPISLYPGAEGMPAEGIPADPFAALDQKKPAGDGWGPQAPIPHIDAVAGMLSGNRPPTNDPMSGEPQLDVPLPRPRPDDLGGEDAMAAAPGAPLSLAPRDYADKMPPNAAPEGPGFLESLGKKLLDPNKAATWMALGSGFAGAGSIGTGMRRAFGNAVPALAADRAQSQKQEGVAATYRALIAKGVPPHEALAASQNPILMKAVADKYFDDQNVPHEIGTDRFGNKIQGSFNKRSGKYYDTSGREIKPESMAGGAGLNTGQPQDGGGVSGEPFLKTLPDRAYADKIKAIAEGREPFPQGQIMRSPYGRKLGEDVLAYDPTFDAVNYKSRENTRKDFTSGKSAVNLTSFNTTISHLDSLAKAAEKLKNSNFPHWNTLANAVAGSYDPKFQEAAKEFQASRTAVADELTRSFRGSGGNVHDIKAWEATINQADSPAALRSAIKQAAELLRGRIDAVGDQYNKGMGTTKDPLELLNPNAAKAFKRLHEQDPQRGPGAPESAAPPRLEPGASTTINGVTIKRLN